MHNRGKLTICAVLTVLQTFHWAIPGLCAETDVIELRPRLGSPPVSLTLSAAVREVRTRYPRLLEAQSEVKAANQTVTVQKIREYLPEVSLSYQDVAGSHNRLTQTLFGTPVLPSTPGPGPERVSLRGDAFSAAGFLVSWDPIDFGLHRARIQSAKAQAALAGARFGSTLLQAEVEAASRYLDAIVMKEQINVAVANVERFADFSKVVHAQVDSGLQPLADASLADAQLANAQNDLIRARLSYDLAKAALAQAVGLAGQPIDIEPGGIIVVTEPDRRPAQPEYLSHPFAIEGTAYISGLRAQKEVLSRQYFPRLRWLGGMNFRGTTFLTNRGDVRALDVSGFFPYIPNWNVGAMIDWTPSEIIRLKAEKKVVDSRIEAGRHALESIIQNLQTQHTQARARVEASAQLAANMPVQVQAAELAARQAQARYQAGLTTVAQVTEANRLLAESRVKLAVANVGVWRALLDEATVHGDLQPFLAEADKATVRGR